MITIDTNKANSILILTYDKHLQQHLDTSAQALGYDNINSAISYANEPSVIKFQDEGKAFRAWRSLFWEAANAVKQQVIDSTRDMPSLDELIEELPKLTVTYTEG